MASKSSRSAAQPRSGLALRPDEILIRTDVVLFTDFNVKDMYPYPAQPAHLERLFSGPLASMSITSERILVLPPCVPWYRNLGPVSWIVSIIVMEFSLGTRQYIPPLRGARSFELSSVEKLSKWRPEFSGPPTFWIHGEMYSFRLMVDKPPWSWRCFAGREAVREHFEALEKACSAANAECTPTSEPTAD